MSGLPDLPRAAWVSMRDAWAFRQAMASTEGRWRLAVCLAVLLINLLLTALGVRWLHEDVREEGQFNFDRHAERLDTDVNQRFWRVVNTFKGLRGYVVANQGRISRDAFRIWVASRRIAEDMPGVRGIGFIQRVDREDLAAFVEAERLDYAPGFTVHTQTHASDLYVIKFIEPLVHNEKAWGYDIGSEPIRRAAAQRAVATGEPSLTGRIVLVQDGRKRPGYLFFMPVYKWASKIDTPQDRQRNLVGLIYSPIIIEEFLSGITDVADGQIDVEVFDGAKAVDEAKVFDTGLTHTAAYTGASAVSAPSSANMPAQFEAMARLAIGGHELLLNARSTRRFEERFERGGIQWLGLAGVALSLLVAAILWLMMAGRARAQALAESMTSGISEAKRRAEVALRDNTALLDTLHRFNLMSAADRQGTIIDVNEAFCRVSGYAPDELIGQRHAIINSGVHEAAFWRQMWRTISSGQAWEGEVCNRAKNGELYWVKTVVMPLFDADGQIEKYLSIRTDITANKRNEQALRAMAERYQLAIDGGSDGLWDWLNVTDHKMWWSPQLYRMLGYEADEFPASLGAFECMQNPNSQHEMIKAMEGALKHHRPLDVLCSLRTKSGQYRWFRCRGKVFFDDEGYPIRMAGAMQDVHERHIAEEVVQKHSEQLSAIFSLSPDGFVSFGADRQVNYASAAYSTLTGLSEESVLCLDEREFLEQLLALCVNPPELRSLDDLLRSPDQIDPLSWLSRHRLVLELQEPAGRMLALSLYQTHGDTVSRLLLVHDVTHEAEVDRMKSTFLSMAAHELRTPMASIYGFVELMMTRELKPEKQKDLLGKVYRQCEVMIAIINELLDLARIEHQRGADFERQRCDLVELVAGVVHDFKTPQDREGPQLTRPDAPVRVEVDRKKMQQAFLNVLSNAYKYSPQGGSVRVSFPARTGEDGMPWCGVSVTDSGIGMSPEQLAHMGERFFRVDKSGNIPGTGLGVSIVKEIMDLMGGTLEVNSALGQGTTMTLWMPQYQAARIAALTA